MKNYLLFSMVFMIHSAFADGELNCRTGLLSTMTVGSRVMVVNDGRFKEYGVLETNGSGFTKVDKVGRIHRDNLMLVVPELDGIKAGDSVITIVNGSGEPIPRTVEKVVVAKHGAMALLSPIERRDRLDSQADRNWFGINFIYKLADQAGRFQVGDSVVATVGARGEQEERLIRQIAVSAKKTLMLLTSLPGEQYVGHDGKPWYFEDYVAKKVQEYTGIRVGDTVISRGAGRGDVKEQRVQAIVDSGRFLLEDGLWWHVSNLIRLPASP